MASTAAPPPSFSLLLKTQNTTNQLRSVTPSRRRRRSSSSQGGFWILAAAQDSKNPRQRAPPGVDTRIHWDNPDEGWIGGSSSKPKLNGEEEEKNLLGEEFSDLLDDSSDSHYQAMTTQIDIAFNDFKTGYRVG
ncbi:NAD(P)H-quinone oxidoreductase subunit T, chloroplastic [Vitis vinifera]|uniref:NAD(P)H-quinone oxidoreductase subunit T, chloroplastic n=1 Tax=Vitis vinifera TaxID=29760 RepID=A0A438E109_VITVI|nr:NAD(P)H-quinone oxidoreductase subunit T, chloroplastic [Vitis vinifera]